VPHSKGMGEKASQPGSRAAGKGTAASPQTRTPTKLVEVAFIEAAKVFLDGRIGRRRTLAAVLGSLYSAGWRLRVALIQIEGVVS
jgi:hypothetical protein